MKKGIAILALVVLALAGLGYWLLSPGPPPPQPRSGTNPQTSSAPRPRVLFVDSYHRGYRWSDEIIEGVLRTLNVRRAGGNTLDMSRSRVDLRIFYMDTKRHVSERIKQEAGLAAFHVIEEWQPDVVITADDNAAKYLIQPYLIGRDLPVVFCGLNWDASRYGLPAENVTGMVQVALVERLTDMLGRYATGRRIGVIGADLETNRKDAEGLRAIDPDLWVRLVDNFDDWKAAYLEMQSKADIGFVTFSQSIKGWDAEAAHNFVVEHASIPVGTWQHWLLRYALISVSVDPHEQGEWAADAALRILDGTSPRDIPVVTNKRARLYLNMPMAARTGVIFPQEWIDQAELHTERKHRILFINSYHASNPWSDGVEKGFMMALDLRPSDLHPEMVENATYAVRFTRMDTKRHPTDADIAPKVRDILGMIREWSPNLIVASDDNAVRHIVQPHLLGGDIPVLVCGVNWDAEEYGLPAKNVRGMVEVHPAHQVLLTLKDQASGPRVGLLGADTFTNRKSVKAYGAHLGIQFAKTYLVRDVKAWNEAFVKLQTEADLVLLASVPGIADWDPVAQQAFVEEHIQIPTGTTDGDLIGMSVFGMLIVPEEQGWWCGKQAADILSGELRISDIEMTTNQRTRTLINTRLANRLGIQFPAELVMEAALVGQPEAITPNTDRSRIE